MTNLELKAACDRAEALAFDLGLEEAAFCVKLARVCKTDNPAVLPGLFGKVLSHGNKQTPTVVRLRCDDVRAWLAKKAA